MQYSRKMALADRWNRISFGTPTEMRIFAQTLKAFRQEGWVQRRTRTSGGSECSICYKLKHI